ncbi:MAG: hypothetical protein P9X22_05040 [Candidatus Zapsychrus exili]|nr:hypothetical protein [Candidatus Zapsychrus exili]
MKKKRNKKKHDDICSNCWLYNDKGSKKIKLKTIKYLYDPAMLENNFDISKYRVNSKLPTLVREYLDNYIFNLKKLYKREGDYFSNISSWCLIDDPKLNDPKYVKRNFKNIYDVSVRGFIIHKVLFENSLMLDVWNSFIKTNSTATIELVNYFLYNYFKREIRLDFYVEDVKQRQETIKKLTERLEELTKTLKDSYLILVDNTSEEYRRRFSERSSEFEVSEEIYNKYEELSDVFIKELHKVDKCLDSDEFKKYIYLQSPESRKNKVENADTIFVFRNLEIEIGQKFDKPMLGELETIVTLLCQNIKEEDDAEFESEKDEKKKNYSYSDLSSYTLKSRQWLKK